MGTSFDVMQPEPPGLTIDSVDLRDRVRVLRVAGEIDMLTAPDLEAAIDHDLSHRPATLIIDLSKITFIDSSGLAALFEAHRRSAGVVRVVVTPAIDRILGMVGMRETLQLHGDLDDALDHVSRETQPTSQFRF